MEEKNGTSAARRYAMDIDIDNKRRSKAHAA
jgi:hypothetical protein